MLYGGTAVLFAGYAAPVSGGGGCVRRFGDRTTATCFRSLSPIFAVSPYLMKTRNIAQNYIRDAVEIARAEQDITQKRAAGMEHFGLPHVLLAVYVRTDLCPGPGDRGEHDRQKEMSPDTVIKLRFDPSDTADVVYQRFNAKVQEVKNVLEDTSFGALAGAFHLAPGLLLKFLVWALQVSDYFGACPDPSPISRTSTGRCTSHLWHRWGSAHFPSPVRFRQCAGILVFRPEAAGV